MASKKSVLFVCMGNICRSPAGEGLFRALVKKRGLQDEIEIDSAGTIGYHSGASPDSRMTIAAAKRGYELTGQARHFHPNDFDRFDLIVAMDRANRDDLLALDFDSRHRDKVRLLCEFVPDCDEQDVPDPYYGGPAGFEHVLDLIEKGAGPILDYLTAGAEPGKPR